MAIKIEKVKMTQTRLRNKVENWENFLAALKNMKADESFVMQNLPSNYRLAITVAQTLLERTYITRQIENGYRIGRIK